MNARDKIAKLLKIAQDPAASPGERAAAQKQVERLMVKHEISPEPTPQPGAHKLDQDVTTAVDSLFDLFWTVKKSKHKKR